MEWNQWLEFWKDRNLWVFYKGEMADFSDSESLKIQQKFLKYNGNLGSRTKILEVQLKFQKYNENFRSAMTIPGVRWKSHAYHNSSKAIIETYIEYNKDDIARCH